MHLALLSQQAAENSVCRRYGNIQKSWCQRGCCRVPSGGHTMHQSTLITQLKGVSPIAFKCLLIRHFTGLEMNIWYDISNILSDTYYFRYIGFADKSLKLCFSAPWTVYSVANFWETLSHTHGTQCNNRNPYVYIQVHLLTIITALTWTCYPVLVCKSDQILMNHQPFATFLTLFLLLT